jgi:alpha-glucuronidase
VLARLQYQAGHANVWRDAICNWFLRASGIPDAQGRVGHPSGRVEAENMQLSRYEVVEVNPWENASGGKGIVCTSAQGCTATFEFDGAPGKYEINIQYFDQNNGEARFRLYVLNQLRDEWLADDHLPSTKIGGDTSTRHTTAGVMLGPHVEIRIEGFPDRDETAALDYVEIIPMSTSSTSKHP